MGASRKFVDDPRFRERDNPTAKIWDIRPPQSVIDDCKAHVRSTGKPDEWRWHVNTKPPGSNAPIILDTDISVPEKLRASVGMAPCPLCSLQGPRYFHGMLAWWPDEKALRVIGNECGHHYYGADFTEATKAYKRRQSDAASEDFLIANLQRVPRYRQFIMTLQPHARALDLLRKRFLRTMSTKTANAIYRHTSLHHRLMLFEERTSQHGPTTLETVGGYDLFGREMLKRGNLDAEPLLYRAENSLSKLEVADEGALLEALIDWGTSGRLAAATSMNEAWKSMTLARELCVATQEFLSAKNLSNVSAWGRDIRSPIAVAISRDQFGRFELRHHPHHVLITPGQPELVTPLPDLPDRPR